MTFVQAIAIIVGVGFALALLNAINGRTSNDDRGPKARFLDQAIPFALRWVLYSGGVALALAVQHLLTNLRA